MLVEIGVPRELGVAAESRLSFSAPMRETPEGRQFNPRQLLLDDRPAFELSFWCGTCSFLFERLQGSNEKLSLESQQDRLNQGLAAIDLEVLGAFGALLPRGEYLPMLLELQPRLVYPGDRNDYFSHEELDTWRVDGFWGLPNYPRTPYYRSLEASVPGGTSRIGESTDAELYEFAVPMVPPSWNDPARVAHYREALEHPTPPTAVALSLLDVCQPAMIQGPEHNYYAHWCLTHFLLDGHHKMQAAAEAEIPLRLLAIVSIDHSLASRESIDRLGALASQPHAPWPRLRGDQPL
jgi:hypothetical protein